MAIQLVFSKSDDDASWGFRLTGGADCEIPLTVIKVAEGSIADTAGLHVYDIVMIINEKNMTDLTHMEAHDVLKEVGQNFTMTVTRSPTNLHDEEQHNEEVRNILKRPVQDFVLEEHHLQPVINQNGYFEEEEETNINSTKSAAFLPRVDFNPVGITNSGMLNGTEQENKELKTKKWSTFLQRPDRPIVLPKKTESEIPVAEPYRVIITKQPKKSEKTVKNKLDELVKEEATEVSPQDEQSDIQEMGKTEEELNNEDGLEDQNAEFGGEEEPDEEFKEEQEDLEQMNVNGEESPDIQEADLEKNLSLEEQLAQIQQQLQALSKLPTSIQDNLEAVTKQLAKIVGASQAQENLDQEVDSYGEQYSEEEQDDGDLLASIIEETAEALDSNDEYKADITDTSDISEDEADQITFREIEFEEDELRLKREEEEMEAEKERERIELERAAKQDRTDEFHQRRLEQRPTVPLSPVQRPIILPGGRKWSEPEDALPKSRKTKMTDEKICEALDHCAEIITGHTKGINFLKYQPAPKNLDYLQRSEVFRLVHDMDPPKTGIAARSGKVVSEEDYYQNNSFDAGQQTSVKA